MTNELPSDQLASGDVDDPPSGWHQGDVLIPGRFVWLASDAAPSTPEAHRAVEDGARGVFELHTTFPTGVVVLTQSCDLQPYEGRERPYVVVAPLIELEGDDAKLALRGRRTRYAHVPGAPADGDYFADLDRAATVEMGLLSTTQQIRGLRTPTEEARFAAAVGRKFNRFPFPDDLAICLQKWKEKVTKTHARVASPEGEIFRQAIAVRAQAQPAWDAAEIAVSIYLVMEPGWLPEPLATADPTVGMVEELAGTPTYEIAERLLENPRDPTAALSLIRALEDGWARACEPTGVITEIAFELIGSDEMSVASWNRTQSLDLEFLSHVDAQSGG